MATLDKLQELSTSYLDADIGDVEYREGLAKAIALVADNDLEYLANILLRRL